MIHRDAVMEALSRCYDPCCRDRGISVVDMGLIEDVRVDDSQVSIDIVLTTGWCPSVATLNQMMVSEVSRLDGVENVLVEVVFNPVWTMDRLSADARQKLEMPLEPLLPYRLARPARTKENEEVSS